MKYKLLLIGLSCCLGITSYANDDLNFKISHSFGSSKIDGVGPYDQIVETTNGTNYAYMLNMQTNDFVKCIADTNGIEEYSCVTERPVDSSGQPLLATPDGLFFYGNYAYITNFDSNAITKCLNSSTGIDITNCKNVKPANGSGFLLSSGAGISFNGNYGYVVDNLGSAYVQCSISNNQLNTNDCTSYTPRDADGNLLLKKVDQIIFNNDYAYFVNTSNTSTFTKCQTGNHGIVLQSCKNFILPYPIAGTSGLAFHGQQAYFVGTQPSGEVVYSRCDVDSTGINMGSCIDTAITVLGNTSLPTSINFNENLMYITGVTLDLSTLKTIGLYTQCQAIESSIKPGTCFTTTTNFLKVPNAITFNVGN